MKNPPCWLAAALLTVSCNAAQIAQESFNYAPATSLSTQAGGIGWLGAWFHDGEPAVTGAVGLGFTDALGNILEASGLSVDTSGAATTRSLRDLGGGLRNGVWISFLYHLPAANSKFEGVSFYRGTQQVFTVSNPSVASTAAIHLTNNLIGNNNGVNTGAGAFGQTHLIVLKLTKSGGTGGADRVEAFIDPILTGNPPSPAATVDGTNFDFDRVRIAGQDGSALWVDELRLGDSFAEVTPHVPAGDQDTDGDGLSNAREAVLGLDPNESDADLIAAIQAHPDWFDLYTTPGILGLGNGGVMIQRSAGEPVNFVFEVQQSENLTQWGVLETFNRQVELPSGKNFLRLNIKTP
jgi:hypothetical protein